MILHFLPVRMEATLTLERAGDTLIVNGTAHDFSAVPPDGTIPAETLDETWFAGPVRRDAQGLLSVTLRLPHGPDAPHAQRFPAALQVTQDGPVTL